MTHYFKAFGVFGGDDLDACVSVYRGRQVNKVAVDFGGYGCLCQSCADFFRYLLSSDAVIGLYNRAIRQFNPRHLSIR
jgi:hypothetical protein